MTSAPSDAPAPAAASGHQRNARDKRREQSPMQHGVGAPVAASSSMSAPSFAWPGARHASKPHASGVHARLSASQRCGANAARSGCGGLATSSSSTSASSSATSCAASATATSASSAVSTSGGSVAGGGGVREDAARASDAASGDATAATPQCSGAASAATAMSRNTRNRDASFSSSPPPPPTVIIPLAADAAAESNGVQSSGQQLARIAAAVADAAADRSAGASAPAGSVSWRSNAACASVSGSASVAASSPNAQHALARIITARVDSPIAPGSSAGNTRWRASVLTVPEGALPPNHPASAPYATNAP